jgi:nicotinate-nucleotide adenylyltransferase
VELDAETRLALARAAFPGREVELDHHARTVDMLRERRFEDPLFLIGADEFCDFLSWKEPQGVLELARLGVATRPGFPPERLERVLARLERPDRVEFFEIQPIPVSSTEIRAQAARGESIAGLVPDTVAELVARLGLYRPAGYTEAGSAQGDRTA